MEAWKLQTAINDFTDACEADNHDIIRTAKKLRRTYDMLRNPAQQQDVLEQVFPLLDDKRAHVRQCAACVILNMPIQPLCAMPTQIDITLYDNRTGEAVYRKEWEETVPAAQQYQAWVEFAAKHKIYLEDQKTRGFS